MTVIQATVGSFIVFITLVDCIGPTNPTYLVDRLIGKVDRLIGKKPEKLSEKPSDDEVPKTDDTSDTTLRYDSMQLSMHDNAHKNIAAN
jgi:hypothetical protein